MCQTSKCVNKRRLQRLKEVCTRYFEDPEEDMSFDENNLYNYHTLLVDDRLKLIYCMVGKTGSTTFGIMMRRKYEPTLHGSANNKQGLANVGLYFMNNIANRTERQYRLKNYRSFLVARNPYTRLYSGYLHKSMDKNVRKFRNGYKDNNGTTRHLEEKPSSIQLGGGISFDMFLQVIVLAMSTNLTAFNSTRYNGHFTSVWEQCHPCHIRYDYVFKTETLDSDREIFLPLFNKTGLPRANMASDRAHPLSGTSLTKAHVQDPITAIHQLSNNTLSDISSVYRRDCEVFGYGVDSNKSPYSIA